ncbi:MAG: substrate-binding domain-containing protein [Planctomycetes bacterium]|nr:substrate-binding domain-containing protein [Planctomycetota bacterium]
MGCEQVPPTPTSGRIPGEGDLIVLLGPPTSSPQSAGIYGGARLFIQRYPALRLETMTPADNRGESILRTVNQALAKDPKVVCLYVSDPQAAAAAETVIRKGTILVTLGVELDVTGVFGHVREDLTGAAELLGKRLEQIVAEKQSYVLLHRSGAGPTETHCYERFLAEARSYRGITLLEERNAADVRQPHVELIRAMLRHFPHAGLVITLEPSVWLTTGASEALGQNARFATVGAAPALWGYLRSGEATALAGVLDGEMGSLAAEVALAAITESRKAGTVRTAPAELVTRETLGDFAKRYAEAAGLNLQELLSAPATRPLAPTDTPTGP